MQPQVKESISKFMAYVHMSVNDKSKEYLVNERRYNYTTPKSFLEQIKLYRSLLGRKSKDLTIKMERLENGLTKLNSTSAQVRYSSLHFQTCKQILGTKECKKKSVKELFFLKDVTTLVNISPHNSLFNLCKWEITFPQLPFWIKQLDQDLLCICVLTKQLENVDQQQRSETDMIVFSMTEAWVKQKSSVEWVGQFWH